MESLSFSKTLNPSIFPNSHPLKPSFPKTLTLIPSSHQSPTPKTLTLTLTLTLKSLPSLLKPAIISLTAASSIFLSRHSLPALAATTLNPPSSSQSQTHPDELNSLRSLLHQQLKLHNLPEAISVVDQLILLDPSDPDLHLLKANLHTYIGDTDQSRQEIEKILSLNPFVVEAYHGLVMAAARSRDTKQLDLIAGRVEGVMRVCERENKGRELRDLKLLLAQIWIIEGKYEEALKIYEVMVRDEPRDFRPFLCRGIVFTLMRRMEEADESFKLYRKLVPENHPYAQLFEKNLSGIHALVKMRDDGAKVSSLPR